MKTKKAIGISVLCLISIAFVGYFFYQQNFTGYSDDSWWGEYNTGRDYVFKFLKGKAYEGNGNIEYLGIYRGGKKTIVIDAKEVKHDEATLLDYYLANQKY